jgi:fibronectin type 3 domain-containing protein
MAQGKRKLYRIYLDNHYVAQESATSQAAAVRAYKAKEGAGNLRFYKVQAKAANIARKNPIKKQKREKARKASVQRRVAVALAKFLKQANPAMKTSGAQVQRLKGGVLKITPIKANAGKLKRVLSEYGHQRRGGTPRIAAVKRAIRSTRSNPKRRRK